MNGHDRSGEELSRQLSIVESINSLFRKSLSCQSDTEVASACLGIAEEITGSAFGFVGEVNSSGTFDTIAISNPGWDACLMQHSDAMIQIHNMEIRGIWGRVIKEGKPLVTNDPSIHPDRIGLPEGHPPLTSFLGVPFKRGENIWGMMSLANKKGGYRDADLEVVESLSIAFGEVLRNKRAELSANQLAREVMDLSTPVIQIWEGIVAAPIIGMLDSGRTGRFMESLLNAITETNSPVALVDITGVPTIDTQTGQHLIEAITAAKLLGAEVILTGVRPAIAQTLVHLGIDLSEFKTRSSLAAGFAEGLKVMKKKIISEDKKDVK